MDRAALQAMVAQGQLDQCPMDAEEARSRRRQAGADRDNALYNNLPVDPDEVSAFLPDVAALADRLERAIDHLAPIRL